MYHWGCIVVTPGYTDDTISAAGGIPYGASSSLAPTEEDLAAARDQGERVARTADRLLGVPVAA